MAKTKIPIASGYSAAALARNAAKAASRANKANAKMLEKRFSKLEESLQKKIKEKSGYYLQTIVNAVAQQKAFNDWSGALASSYVGYVMNGNEMYDYKFNDITQLPTPVVLNLPPGTWFRRGKEHWAFKQTDQLGKAIAPGAKEDRGRKRKSKTKKKNALRHSRRLWREEGETTYGYRNLSHVKRIRTKKDEVIILVSNLAPYAAKVQAMGGGRRVFKFMDGQTRLKGIVLKISQEAISDAIQEFAYMDR